VPILIDLIVYYKDNTKSGKECERKEKPPIPDNKFLFLLLLLLADTSP
jgi:hypothetical protein